MDQRSTDLTAYECVPLKHLITPLGLKYDFFKLATGVGLGMRLLTIHTIKDNEVCNTHNGHNQVLTLFLCKYFHCREYRMRKSDTHTVKYTTYLVHLTNMPHGSVDFPAILKPIQQE